MNRQNILAALLGLPFVFVGVSHFTKTEFFLQIMPPWIPFHLAAVLISGVAEIALGIMVLVPATRRLAGWGLLALLTAVFPANIHMAINNIQIEGLPTTPTWALWARLPVQFLMAGFVWYVCLRQPSALQPEPESAP